MTVEYTGRQVEVVPELKALVERRLAKLGRVLPGITSSHVVLGLDNHRQYAEVTVHSPGLTLTATDEGTDLGLSLAIVMDKLTRQAQHQLGKWRGRKRRAPARTPALWSGVLGPAESGDERPGPRVIRSRRFLAKPMTVDEAILEVGASEEGLVVYRDAATERVNVLYRRKDGHLGLIEPEA